MKQCPTCQSQYTDDTLQFCLQDGTPLQFVLGSQSKTIAYNEQETLVGNRQSSQINAPNVTSPTNWNPNQNSSNPSFQRPEKKSSSTVAVLLTAFVMLLLFSFVGIGAWLYFRGISRDNSNLFLAKRAPTPETANTSTTSSNAARPLPMATRTTVTDTSSSNTSNANTPSTPVDREQIIREVSQRISSWKSAAESHNLNSYMDNYAGTVDYYNKKTVSAATVRADKQRAFSMYDKIQFTLSNMTITPDASGTNAVAVFDKEWNFSGAGKSSAGKVQQQLQLKKTGGQWLITGERDLKVYYTQ